MLRGLPRLRQPFLVLINGKASLRSHPRKCRQHVFPQGVFIFQQCSSGRHAYEAIVARGLGLAVLGDVVGERFVDGVTLLGQKLLIVKIRVEAAESAIFDIGAEEGRPVGVPGQRKGTVFDSRKVHWLVRM